jgi:cytochrome c-type biogenesis protein CcmH
MKTMRYLLFALLFIMLLAIPAAAQEGDPAKELQQELWCPVCQGVRLDVCEQKVCEQMRDMIDADLAAGKTKEEIKGNFIEFYGPVVLGEPPREGFNLVAWIVPVLLVVGGLLFALFLTRRWSRKSVTPSAPVASEASSVPSADDDYLARVERELGEQ